MNENINSWEFDQWGIKNGKIDETKSWIEIKETDEGQKLTVYTNQKESFSIEALFDQWGIWFVLKIDDKTHTIAHECGTKPFLDALIESLNKFKETCDC